MFPDKTTVSPRHLCLKHEHEAYQFSGRDSVSDNLHGPAPEQQTEDPH